MIWTRITGSGGADPVLDAGHPNKPSPLVIGTGLSSGAANLYFDGSWARAGAAPVNGANSYTATAQDQLGRSDTASVACTLTNGSFDYDLNGNLLGDGTRSFAYDDENELTSVWVTNAWRSDFVYDGMMRRRIRREYTWASGAWLETNEVHYVCDGLLVIQERDANNLPAVSYTRGNDLSRSLQGAGGIGGLLARSDNHLMTIGDPNAHAFYHADGNGNITAMFNTLGIIVARYLYDPFGDILSMSGPLADANLYRFSSKEGHPNSGLVYYGYRFYDVTSQRWLNRDPIGPAGGINLYLFAGNNGIFWIDAYGLHWTDYIPDFLTDPGIVNFAAGMGDVISIDGTRLFRQGLGYDDAVDRCSGAYSAGWWAGTAESLALGVGRLAYAGAAKAGSMALLRQGATAENAAKAIAYRNGLKTAFNLGMADKARAMTMARAMAKYGGDYGEIIKASGRTSAGWNAAGAAFAGAGARGLASKPCKH